MTIYHVIDVETTDLDGEVISVCIARYELETRKVIHQFVNHYLPLVEPSEQARAVNGFSVEAWMSKGARPFTHFSAEAIAPWLSDCETWVGSNPTFDRERLRYMFDRVRVPFPPDQPGKRVYMRDIASLAWPLEITGKVKRASLGALSTYYGLSKQPHTAEGDVAQTIQVLELTLSLAWEGFKVAP